MNRFLTLFALVLVFGAFGCKKEGEDGDAKGAQEPAKAGANTPGTGSAGSVASPPPAGAGGSGNNVNITPMGGVGAGPMTPVAGSEGLQGGGSAAGQIMKDKAKNLAAQPPSSLNQAGGEDGN